MINEQEILHDTLVNYDNLRFADAGRSFHYLMHNSTKNIDRLYFAYRALDAYKRSSESHELAILKVWQELGIFAFQQLSEEYEENLEVQDKRNTILEVLIQTFDKTVELLQRNRKKLIELNLSEINEITDSQKRIELLEKFLAVKITA